jgi:hypothetical protein
MQVPFVPKGAAVVSAVPFYSPVSLWEIGIVLDLTQTQTVELVF